MMADRLKVEPATFRGLNIGEVFLCAISALIVSIIMLVFVLLLLAFTTDLPLMAFFGIGTVLIVVGMVLLTAIAINLMANTKAKHSQMFIKESVFLLKMKLLGTTSFIFNQPKTRKIWSRCSS